MSGPLQWIIMKIIWWLLGYKASSKIYFTANRKSKKNSNCSGGAKASGCAGTASQGGVLWSRRSSEWAKSTKCMKTTTMTKCAAFSSTLLKAWLWMRNRSSENGKLEEHGTSRSKCSSAVLYRICFINAEIICKNAWISKRAAKCFWSYVSEPSRICTNNQRQRWGKQEVRCNYLGWNRCWRPGLMSLTRIASWGNNSREVMLCTEAIPSRRFSNCGVIWRRKSGSAERFGESCSWKK